MPNGKRDLFNNDCVFGMALMVAAITL